MEESVPAWNRKEAAALLAIIAGASLLRFWQLAQVPLGIDLDEARNGIEVLKVLAGAQPLFFQTFDPREPAFVYSLSFAVRAVGHTVLAMRLTVALWGLLGVLLTYPVARQWFGPKVALLATAGMAGSFWDLAMSRWAERDITLLPPLLLFFFFFWRGFERRSTPSFAIAGVFVSLGAYAYVAARILPLLILLLLVVQYWLDPRSILENWRGLLAALLAAAATIAPLAVYFVRSPSIFFGRISQVTSLGQPLPGVRPDSVWQTVLNTLGMFFWRGDGGWRQNLPYRPVFSWWLAIPFCVGLLWAAWHAISPAWKVRAALDERSSAKPTALYPCAWLLLWQAALLVPAFLARPSPQFDRTIGSAPSTYILLALGLAGMYSWIRARRIVIGNAALAISASLLALLGVDTFRAYFGAWAKSDAPLRVYEYGQTFDADFLNQRRPPPDKTFIFLGYHSSTAVRYLAPEYSGAVRLEDYSQLLPIPSSGPATYVFAAPSLGPGQEAAVVQRYMPDASVVARRDFPAGDPAALVFQLSEAQLSILRGDARPLSASFGGRIELLSISLGQTNVRAKPGDVVRFYLMWQVLAPIASNIGPFVHMVDSTGKVITQDDRQGLADGGWRPGQQFVSMHVLRLPAGVRPGQYRALAGVDRRTGSQPSYPLAELGPQVDVLRVDVGQ
ncbi:MAG: glycosyltransferase family 39 protein [Chloroflexota bacterium]|nr:glycosyltransferase family 39 protein [Chloroflexota bacterium]